jgi:uracil-DNA glycosylase family 4
VKKPISSRRFDPKCRDCTRLASHLDAVRAEYPRYYAKPVEGFGPRRAALLVVGLAPGMHGANRSGRPFTGDHAGILLYRTLYKFGFANQPDSVARGDALKLFGCRITNAVKCLPPENKPLPDEVRRCNPFLAAEIAGVRPRAILALGAVAHRAVLMALELPAGRYRFAHHSTYELPVASSPIRLFDSYHCSRYNTQTKRLTTGAFEAVFSDISHFLRGFQ